MADIKKTLREYRARILHELCSSELTGKYSKLKTYDVTLEDLEMEGDRLQLAENKILRDRSILDDKIDACFRRGLRITSERQVRMIARRIYGLFVEAGNFDRELWVLSKQRAFISSLWDAKRHPPYPVAAGSDKGARLDVAELITHIETGREDGEFDETKLDELLGVLEKSDVLPSRNKEDEITNEISRQMQEAREVADNPEVLRKRYEEFVESIRSAVNEASREAHN